MNFVQGMAMAIYESPQTQGALQVNVWLQWDYHIGHMSNKMVHYNDSYQVCM